MDRKSFGDNGKKRDRRSVLKALFAGFVTGGGFLWGTGSAKAAVTPEKRTSAALFGARQPLISQYAIHGNFVFVKGMGDHDERDIRVATTNVLDMIEEQLTLAGSSMEQALKVTVFLRNLRDYDAMNEAYLGRFGDQPPARSTVACYNGIPGGSLLEIDCIAAL